MKRIFSTLPIVLVLLLSISAQASDIELTESDMPKLVGKWVGDRDWQPTGQKAGSGRHERLFLEIKKNGKSVITPEKKPNKKISASPTRLVPTWTTGSKKKPTAASRPTLVVLVPTPRI